MDHVSIIYYINMEMGWFGFTRVGQFYNWKGVLPPGRKMSDLYKDAAPFLVCDAISMSLIIAFPQIALWLPGAMITR